MVMPPTWPNETFKDGQDLSGQPRMSLAARQAGVGQALFGAPPLARTAQAQTNLGNLG
jgi:hypothetical protein